MSRTTLLIVLTLLIPINSPAAEKNPPNILFLLTDDMGHGDIGCYGRQDVQTPHMDSLARDGVRFTNFYANGPECSPTRTAFLTGRYQQWVGGLECAIGTGNVGRYDDAIRLRARNDLGLPTDQQTIVRMLKDAGYRTGITGKWHLGYEPKFAPHLHGFDHTFYCIGGGMDYFHYLDNKAGYNLFQDGQPIRREGYFTELITAEAIRFLSQESNKPFFLYVPYTAPHFPYQGPDDKQQNPLPLESPLWSPNNAPPEVYVNMIESVDASVGKILEMLQKLKLEKETVVFFASDNGGPVCARNAPFSGYKGSTHEGGIHVPAMIRWPGVIAAGTVSQQSCITFDFTRSMANLAGIKESKQKPFEGIDILQHVAQKKQDIRRTLYWREPRGDAIWKGVRKGRWKFIGHKDGDSYHEFLFDLYADPAEKKDLKDVQPAVFADLKKLYTTWEKTTRANRRGRPEGEE